MSPALLAQATTWNYPIAPNSAVVWVLGGLAILALLGMSVLGNMVGSWKCRALDAEAKLAAIASGHDLDDPAADQP